MRPTPRATKANELVALRNQVAQEQLRADTYLSAFRREEARADRYLAAIRAYLVAVDTAEDFATVDREEAPLRAIVEEAKRER